MAVRLGSRSDVSNELNKIRANQTALGLPIEPREGPGWHVRGADISPHFKMVGINVWDKDDYLGLVVFSETFPAVEFGPAKGQRGSSALAEIDGDIWLLHTGKFWGGLYPPIWDETTELDGKTYFKVSSTRDREFFGNVCRYYLSRQLHPPYPAEEVEVPPGGTKGKPSPTPTRRGQELYRRNLMKVEKCCRVTGVSDPRLLRASHMKPWALCETNKEQLDGYNGLLLAPHIDHLFDRGYISFEDEGSMLVSQSMDPDQLRHLGIATSPPSHVGAFHPSQRPYLDFHRTLFGF